MDKQQLTGTVGETGVSWMAKISILLSYLISFKHFVAIYYLLSPHRIEHDLWKKNVSGACPSKGATSNLWGQLIIDPCNDQTGTKPFFYFNFLSCKVQKLQKYFWTYKLYKINIQIIMYNVSNNLKVTKQFFCMKTTLFEIHCRKWSCNIFLIVRLTTVIKLSSNKIK